MLVCSFSGGETSAYMAIKLKEKHNNKVSFVFANTGEEMEETLVFADRVDREYGLGLVWIEAVINPEKGKGTTYKVVDFKTASRNGEPFERMIEVYGLPNPVRMYCTRELKTVPLTKYKKDHHPGCLTAVGIRADEVDRISPNHKEKGLIYPLVNQWPMTKNQVNSFWREQPFRLNLKHYQGNCKWCYKKSFSKLAWIMKQNPEYFEFPERMERVHAKTNWTIHGNDGEAKIFRGHKKVSDIRAMSANAIEPVDDAKLYHFNQDLFGYEYNLDSCESESCEAF